MRATKEVFSAYTFAYELAQNRKDEYVTVEHLLYGIIEENNEIVEVLKLLGANITTIKKNLLKYMDEHIDKSNQRDVYDADSFRECFILAEQFAETSERQEVGLEHIMAAIFSAEQSYAFYYLSEQGILRSEFLFHFCHREELEEGFSHRNFESESYGGSYGSSYDGSYDGSHESSYVDSYHSSSNNNHPNKDSDRESFLTKSNQKDSNSGVSYNKEKQDKSDSRSTQDKKELILKNFTQNLNETVKKKSYDKLIGRTDVLDRTIQILCRKLKNNPIHIGEPGVGKTAITLGLAERINEGKVPNKLKDSIIYSIDIGSLLAGTKYRGDFEERIKNVLEAVKSKNNPIVYIDEIHTIVGAGSIGEGTMDASNLLKPYLTDGSIKFIGATTYDEYKKHFEKDKALTRRFSKIDVKETTVKETIEILENMKSSFEDYHKVTYTQDAIEQAVYLSDKYMTDRFLPDKAIDIMDEAGAYISAKESTKKGAKKVIDELVIETIIAKTCKIPKQTVVNNEISALKNLEGTLNKSIFGQEEAIHEVVRCIKLSRSGLKDEDKPIAAMLFVGPTGVGKTEIARSLSKTLGIELVRFDMSEYGEKHSAAKLIGAPPGYVGYEEGGLLTDSIRKKPNCVLLLDEIEKAHEDVFHVLLQIMDYASLSDNQGRKADFRNVIIIMTSNAGARYIGKSSIGFNQNEVSNDIMFEEVKKVFTPEFRNRLDKVIAFHHVNDKMALNIVKKELNLLKDKLKSKNTEIKFSQKLIQYVAKKGVSKEFGAREIKRIIDSEIKPLLVEELLFGKLKNGGSCKIDVNSNVLLLIDY